MKQTTGFPTDYKLISKHKTQLCRLHAILIIPPDYSVGWIGQGQVRRQYSIYNFVSLNDRIEYGYFANGVKWLFLFTNRTFQNDHNKDKNIDSIIFKFGCG